MINALSFRLRGRLSLVLTTTTSRIERRRLCFPVRGYPRTLTTLGSPDDRKRYPPSASSIPPTPGRPTGGDPLKDLKKVHGSFISSPSTISHREEVMRAEASSFLHVLEEHDPSAPCPMCINGDAGTCSSLETRDEAVDEAYEQAEGPEGSEIDREERKSIVQARARDMDDERTPCVIQEQHRLQEQLEDESHSVKEDESTCLVESKEVRTSQAGGHFRRAGQLRVTREPGPSDDTEMLKTAGYGSQGARESGKGYGDVFWEGGTPMFLTEDKARDMFEHGVAGPTDAAKIRKGEIGKLAELTCDETQGSLDQKEVHSKILRALKEEGEMDSLRRTNHPGGQLANERFTRSKANRANDKDTEKQAMNKGGLAKGRTDEEPRSS